MVIWERYYMVLRITKAKFTFCSKMTKRWLTNIKICKWEKIQDFEHCIILPAQVWQIFLF
jgi:hypothetical protein